MTLLVSALTQGRNGVDGPTVAAVGFGLVERRVAQPLVTPSWTPSCAHLASARRSAAPGRSLSWRLAVPMVAAESSTGMLNAVLDRGAVASVPPDRAAMGSGANNTARYLGATPSSGPPRSVRRGGRPVVEVRAERASKPLGGMGLAPPVVVGGVRGQGVCRTVKRWP